VVADEPNHLTIIREVAQLSERVDQHYKSSERRFDDLAGDQKDMATMIKDTAEATNTLIKQHDVRITALENLLAMGRGAWLILIPLVTIAMSIVMAVVSQYIEGWF